MSSHKDTFDDRRNAAAEAKKKLLERFRAQPPADDPAVLARLAAQKLQGEARMKREAEAASRAEEKAAAAAAAKAAEVARKIREAEDAAQAIVDAKRAAAALLVEQKAARDARYAARKKRR
ncbi:MAG: Pst pyosin-like [Rubritepida sp.]|nr:Pst pyosin-like [Rubritepida sp.]